jgi:hypothetical protein
MQRFWTRWGFLFFVALFLTGSALAFDPIKTSGRNLDMLKLLPPMQSFNGKALLFNGKSDFIFTQSAAWDCLKNRFTVETRSSSYLFNGVVDSTLRLHESTAQFYDPAMIAFLGHDRRVTSFDEQRQKLTIDYYLKNKKKSTKTVTYDANTVDSDTLFLFLQAMMAENNPAFSGSLILNSKGLRLDADFERVAPADFAKLTPEYRFPERFAGLLKPAGGAYVYVLKLPGLVKAVFPYRYYYAFKKTAPYNLLAIWGGDPREAEFYFVG